MVAREYFEGQIYERISQMTCHVARFMGLQQWNRRWSDQPAMDAERINLFWTLFVNDKQRAFLTGQPCDLYLFDSDLRLQKPVAENSPQYFQLAHVHLMSLWEEVYLSLYSLRAARKGVAHRQEQVIKMSALLGNWSFQYKELLNKPSSEDTPLTANLRLELLYAYNISQILVHRCHPQDSSRHQVLTSSRAALTIIRDVHQSDFTLGGTYLLCRLIRRYPALAFHELQYHFLRTLDPATLDPHLLLGMRDALTALRHTGFPRAYYTRFHIGVEWSLALTTKLRHAVLQLPPSLTASAASSRPNSGPTTPKSKPASAVATHGSNTPARKRSVASSRAASTQRPSISTGSGTHAPGPRGKRKSTASSRATTAGNSPVATTLASPAGSAMEDVHWYPPASAHSLPTAQGFPPPGAIAPHSRHPSHSNIGATLSPSQTHAAGPFAASHPPSHDAPPPPPPPRPVPAAPYTRNPPLFAEPTALPALSHSPPDPPSDASSLRTEAAGALLVGGSGPGAGPAGAAGGDAAVSAAFGASTLMACTAQDASTLWADLCGDLGTGVAVGAGGPSSGGGGGGGGGVSGGGDAGGSNKRRASDASGEGAAPGKDAAAALDAEFLDGFVPYGNGWGGPDPWDVAAGGDEILMEGLVAMN